MQRSTRVSKIMCSGAISVIALSLIALSAAALARQTGDTLTVRLPQRWIPFSADVTIRMPNHDQHGRFFRAGNGSTAYHLRTAAGPLITINNVEHRRTYAHFPDKGWIEYEISTSALAPPKHELVLGVYNTRKLPSGVTGGDIYELSHSNGRVIRFAAALNGMPIYLTDANGIGQEYKNIVMGEPPNSAFMPPAGTATKRVQAKGILPSRAFKTYLPQDK